MTSHMDNIVPLREPRPAVAPERLELFTIVGVWFKRHSIHSRQFDTILSEWRNINNGQVPEDRRFWRDAAAACRLIDSMHDDVTAGCDLAARTIGTNPAIFEVKPNGGGA